MGRIWQSILGVVLAGLLLGAGGSGVQAQGGRLLPAYDGGALVVAGEGFQPGERVTLVVAVVDDMLRFGTVADGQGRFWVRTGVTVPPGVGLGLNALGDQGTTAASITSVPLVLPQPAASWVPGVDPLFLVAALGALLAVAGLVLLFRPARQGQPQPQAVRASHRRERVEQAQNSRDADYVARDAA